MISIESRGHDDNTRHLNFSMTFAFELRLNRMEKIRSTQRTEYDNDDIDDPLPPMF